MIPLSSKTRVRLARPSADLSKARRFYVQGLGLHVLYEHERTPSADPLEWSLLMLGMPDATWHLELTHNPHQPQTPTPTPEDALVFYLGQPVNEQFVQHLIAHGGQQVEAHNPYWTRWGASVADPDGYRVILCERTWDPEES